MTEKKRRVAIMGAGAMGQALARGLMAASVFTPEQIVAADVDKGRLTAFSDETGVESAGNVEAASSSDIIILAVKPAVIPAVLEEISNCIGHEQVVISIAAGITIQQIESKLKDGVPVIRAMPNIPCMVGAGAIVLSRGKNASDSDFESAIAIFNAVGKAIEVPELLMDAVTGLSGSGPAFVYVVIEALADAGMQAGLTSEQSAFLAVQTVFGAAKMVIDTGEHPARLRDMVTSPGGTTIAGLAALERGALRAAIIDAVEAAVERSRELSQD